jgi:hypothetical protein
MRGILAAAERQRTRTQRDGESAIRREAARQHQMTARSSLHRSRYDRSRLYEELWAEPTQKVAQRHGVSDVAIAKACTLLDIPKPPRG